MKGKTFWLVIAVVILAIAFLLALFNSVEMCHNFNVMSKILDSCVGYSSRCMNLVAKYAIPSFTCLW